MPPSQHSTAAYMQVQNLAGQRLLGDLSGFDTRQLQIKLRDQLLTGPGGGQPSFTAVVLHAADGSETSSNANYSFANVPSGLAERVGGHSELALVCDLATPAGNCVRGLTMLFENCAPGDRIPLHTHPDDEVISTGGLIAR